MEIFLETSRLYLREIRITEDDLSIYLSWLQDTKSNSFIQSARHDYTLEQLIGFIDAINSDTNAILLGIFLRIDDRFIGTIKIQPIDHSAQTAWFGIMIGHPDFRGQGYGREAMEIVLEYLFNTLKLSEIYLGVDLKNRSAISLYKSLGFVEEKKDLSKMVMRKETSSNFE